MLRSIAHSMASRDALVDTTGLCALINRNDPAHGAARAAVGKLLRDGRRLVVTDYVIDESATFAKAHGGAQLAGRVLELIEQSHGFRIEWIGPERFEATKAFFRRHADHGYSFTDCSSFVVMRELRLTHALTSDRHFTEAGLEVLLPVS
ncbi:MAG TPA: PIN domain-containing protein [Steroidobacteraceae bacterium]|nr:PIN domain-containing protein [Steroidobacteraceae bacterium]